MRAVHLMIGRNWCLSAILIQNCLACMQISYEYKMQTVILRGVHMSQQDLHGCSETLKIMQSIVTFWCGSAQCTMKHCGILLQDTCMRVGTGAPVPPPYKWLRPSGRVTLEGRLGGSFSTVVVVMRDIIVQNSVTAVCREEIKSYYTMFDFHLQASSGVRLRRCSTFHNNNNWGQ